MAEGLVIVVDKPFQIGRFRREDDAVARFGVRDVVVVGVGGCDGVGIGERRWRRRRVGMWLAGADGRSRVVRRVDALSGWKYG